MQPSRQLKIIIYISAQDIKISTDQGLLNEDVLGLRPSQENINGSHICLHRTMS
jgi:hypothetical protein